MRINCSSKSLSFIISYFLLGHSRPVEAMASAIGRSFFCLHLKPVQVGIDTLYFSYISASVAVFCYYKKKLNPTLIRLGPIYSAKAAGKLRLLFTEGLHLCKLVGQIKKLKTRQRTPPS